MQHPLLIHGVWLLFGAGAFVAGTFHPRGLSPSAPAATGMGNTVSGPMASRQTTPQNPSTKAARDDGTTARWLEAFRGRDGAISAEHMKEAMLTALREPDPVKSTLFFAQLMNELTAENAPAAFQTARDNMGGPDSMRSLSLLAHAWGEKDGKAALAAFEALRGRESDVAKTAALAAWASTDPDAAMKWLQENGHDPANGTDPFASQQPALTRGMITGLARRDVDTALKYLMTLDESQQGEFVSLLADQKTKESVLAGAEWAQSLPTERMRTNALETVGGQFLRRDLNGALEWAQKIAERPDAHEAVADVANELAGRNPLLAAAWVSRLSPGASQDHAFEDVFETWTRADPTAASQNLSGMEPGPGRDSAIQAFSRTLARENPTDALAWAGAMTDPKERTDVQIEIARRWQAASPLDAQAWIAANLPPEAQARALAPRRR